MSSGYAPPPWQVPPRRTGWGDPRPQQQHQHAHHGSAQSPISPINPQAFAYHPPDQNQSPGYGAQPQQQHNIPQYDTSSWGVKYNQGQGQSPQWQQTVEDRPPALPPRPTSTNPTQQYGQAQWSAPYGTASTGTQQQTSHQQQPSWSGYNYDQQTLYGTDLPPAPPPKPPVYDQTSQQYPPTNVPTDQYSHHAPTHHYDPQTYPANAPGPYDRYTPTPGPVHGAVQDGAPVSPIDGGAHRWQASRPPASTASQADTHPAPQPGSGQFYSNALGPYGGPSDWEYFGNEGASSPDASTPLSAHAKPVPSTFAPAASTQTTSQTPAPEPSPPMKPARPVKSGRQGSDTSTISQGVRRTETIDGVINAWSAPLKLGTKNNTPATINESRPQSRDSVSQEPVKERIVEVVKEVVKVVDPYDDLQPEVRASLKRYADMLRKEAAAETDEAKFAAFEAFIKKELRLRAMLYGMDSPLQLIKNQEMHTPSATPSVPTTQSEPMESSIPPPPVAVSIPAKQKEEITPQLQKSRIPTSQEPPLEAKTAVAPEHFSVARTPPRAGASNSAVSQSQSKGPSMNGMAAMLKDSPVRSSPSKDDPFVMVGTDDGEEYSPGGRPIAKKVADEAYSPGGRPIAAGGKQASTQPRHVPEISIPTVPQSRANIMSPGANAPMVLEDYVMPGLPSPGSNAPILVEPPSPTPPSASANAPIPVDGTDTLSKRSSTGSNLKFEPPRPVYTPFRYNPTVQAPLMPADKSYSSLRKDGAESGRLLKHDSASSGSGTPAVAPNAPSSLQLGSKMQDEAFIGLIRQQSMAVRKLKPATEKPPPVPSLRPGTPAGPTVAGVNHARTPTPIAALRPGTPAAPANNIQTAVAILRALLPESVPDEYGLSANDKVNALKAKIDAVPDQFSFIHQTVVEWDQRNRQVRKRLDDERNHRQADSEARIDDMFNDNEIGYADIGELEAEFKLSEARLKYDEDKDELDVFTRDVYEIVTGQLQSELTELHTSYTTAVDLLDLDSEPASQCVKTQTSKTPAQRSPPPEMSHTMSLLLSISNKIETRQQKIAEAKVERERRRKRLELTVLYTNGDTAGVKTLEAEFATAEKMQVLHEARERDNRANKLMDTFDRATVRGLGDNQTMVDELLPKIRQLRDMVLQTPSPAIEQTELFYGSQGVRPTLALCQATIDLLLADSQKLLTLSNIADKLLNDADYSVSVAEARVSNADRATYDKLKEEKEKEDAKIVEDTQGRMNAVGKGPVEMGELCREVVGRVGDDPEHKERMGRALEEAKARAAGGG